MQQARDARIRWYGALGQSSSRYDGVVLEATGGQQYNDYCSLGSFAAWPGGTVTVEGA